VHGPFARAAAALSHTTCSGTLIGTMVGQPRSRLPRDMRRSPMSRDGRLSTRSIAATVLSNFVASAVRRRTSSSNG